MEHTKTDTFKLTPDELDEAVVQWLAAKGFSFKEPKVAFLQDRGEEAVIERCVVSETRPATP